MACAVEPLLGEVFLVPHEIDVRRTRDYGESVVCFIGIWEALFTDMRLFFIRIFRACPSVGFIRSHAERTKV